MREMAGDFVDISSAKRNFTEIILYFGFNLDGKDYIRKVDDIRQFVNLYTDRVDSRRYIEFSISKGDKLLVSGRADRAFPQWRHEIISSLSGGAANENFDFTSWLTYDFLGMLDGMKTSEGVLKICRDQLDGKALIAADVRRSW